MDARSALIYRRFNHSDVKNRLHLCVAGGKPDEYSEPLECAGLMLHSDKRRAVVLLATFNGEAFLEKQMDTLRTQSFKHIDILVSDDGSSDKTAEIVDAHARNWQAGRFDLIKGAGRGFAENFAGLIRNAPLDAHWYAFCDQDDEWDRDKIERAIAVLDAQPQDRPAMYCGRTRLIDTSGRTIGLSPLFARRPSFRNAIVQSLAGGNTMVLNGAAFRLLQASVEKTSFVSHDWWAYMLVTGAGGHVHYDPRPSIGYRQHADNLIGDNMRLRSRLNRVHRLFMGGYSDWITRNLAGLEACSDVLNAEARETLTRFQAARALSGYQAVRAFRGAGVHRQSTLANMAMYCASMLRKI